MSAVDLINGYLLRLGQALGVDLQPLDQSGHTSLARGSATLGINIIESSQVLMLLAPIMPVPQRAREELFRRLLELNFVATGDAAFAIDYERDVIYLRALRSLAGLDYDEFAALVDMVSAVANDWDVKLRAEFG